MTSLILALIVTLTLGAFAARREGGVADRVSSALTVLGQSAPLFWVGLVLVIVFAVRLGWLPPGGLYGPTGLVLPSIAIALALVPVQLRIFVVSMREELAQDYIRTADAFGIAEKRIVYRYALRNAILPLLTIVGADMGSLLGGAIVAEAVFNYPGMGNLALNALNNRDYPLLQGVVMVSASIFVFMNLAVDLLYVVVNPRVRLKTQ
jgi:ABC-type dipeptide/oligopeptide/nickel transport system permease component